MKTYFRKVNGMNHVGEEGYLVKTSNGERVPPEEPLFILRGRDALAVETIHHYVGLLAGNGGDPQRMFELGGVVHDFLMFRKDHPERMKLPGSTKGK